MGITSVVPLDWNTCVNLTHATWMWNQYPFNNVLTGDLLQRTLDGALKLGYSYYVSRVDINETSCDSDSQ
jgi:hypothetical protein